MKRAWSRIEHGARDVLDYAALAFTIHAVYGVLENYFLDEEMTGDLDKASRKLIQIIVKKFPNLSQRSKQILLARTLESLSSNTNDNE